MPRLWCGRTCSPVVSASWQSTQETWGKVHSNCQKCNNKRYSISLIRETHYNFIDLQISANPDNGCWGIYEKARDHGRAVAWPAPAGRWMEPGAQRPCRGQREARAPPHTGPVSQWGLGLIDRVWIIMQSDTYTQGHGDIQRTRASSSLDCWDTGDSTLLLLWGNTLHPKESYFWSHSNVKFSMALWFWTVRVLFPFSDN